MAPSRNAVDKLGDRLRAGKVSEADWTLLEELRAFRQQQLDEVVDRIRADLRVEVTSRVKTTNTLIEKLRRERMRFSQMDDLAGARIALEGGRLEQDELVAHLLNLWPDARVKDRRVTPVHGYRAVHVIPSVDGWPLEIQLRTIWQDAIANVLESLADRWGRQLRYGEPPEGPSAPAVPGGRGPTRAGYLEIVYGLGDYIAEVEESIRSRDLLSRKPDRSADEQLEFERLDELVGSHITDLIAVGLRHTAALTERALDGGPTENES